MGKKNILSFMMMAKETALSKNNCRIFLLGAVGVRYDGAIVKSLNSPTQVTDRTAHAEYKLARKLGYNATIYVARIRRDDGQFAMARPCFACRKLLISKRTLKVYYTINHSQYGVWNPLLDTDSVYQF